MRRRRIKLTNTAPQADLSKNDVVARFQEAQSSLVVQHSDFSLKALFDMADSGSIELDPHYQRRDRWKEVKQSALIESFILNVPVPPVYLSEDDFGRYSVIDGKQRITAIRNFLSGKLRLTGLKKFPALEQCNFDELPREIRDALSVRPYIRVITLLKQTDPQLKYEVFLRLNTGGDRLLPQEIRNVAFSGELNDLLFKLSEAKYLRERMKIKTAKSSAYQKMEDIEHVLRYFTISARWESIGQILGQEMDDFMREHRHPNPQKISSLRKSFEKSLGACNSIWGDKSFYKPLNDSGWRSQFISPMFDAEMVACSTLSPAELDAVTSKRAAFLRAFAKRYRGDVDFQKSVSQSTNNPKSIQNRINSTIEVLREFC